MRRRCTTPRLQSTRCRATYSAQGASWLAPAPLFRSQQLGRVAIGLFGRALVLLQARQGGVVGLRIRQRGFVESAHANRRRRLKCVEGVTLMAAIWISRQGGEADRRQADP